MKLSLYNVLSHLIPGYLIYIVIFYCFEIDAQFLNSLSATAVAYLIGYFVNTFGAWIESFLYWTWGGAPSLQLLEGKSCNRIKFSENNKIRKLLIEKYDVKDNSDVLFKVAMRISADGGRISSMNEQYVFSRSILISVFISFAWLSFEFWQSSLFWTLGLLLILISWYRSKERGFYYVKEVLNKALNDLEK